MSRSGLFVCAAALTCTVGCAYPRRATPLSPLTQPAVDRRTQPENLWQLRLVRAEIPREKRSGLSWDDEGGLPDPYFVLSIAGRERWQSPVVQDSLSPAFEAQPAQNLAFDRAARVRMELWDKDTLGGDPIGIYEGRALGEAILDADTTIKLDSGAAITLRIMKPEPKLGVGISSYEVRPSALLILEVADASPAARAGLASGDRIVAIDGKPIKSLSRPQAESALALAAQRKSLLQVERGKAQRKVTLDSGYIWPAR
jgi:hypothetical protein